MSIIIDPDSFVKYVLPSLFGIAALIWNFFNYYQTQKGYLKLKLDCKCECNENNKYIISETSVENTGRRTIDIDHATLTIVKQPHGYDDALEFLDKEMEKDKDFVDNMKNEMGIKQDHVDDITIQKEYLMRLSNVLKNDDIIIILLPYYSNSEQVRLGSLESMSSTEIQNIQSAGIYSIYFHLIGKGWIQGKSRIPRKRDPSQNRKVHDQVILTE
jgi:hypothetical protein